MAEDRKNPQQFELRTDSAAQSLRQQLMKRGADIPESRKVEVGPDGRPPGPLPPEGSYARQAIEQQRRQRAAQPEPQDLESNDVQMQRQDPQATLESDQATLAGDPSSAEEPIQLSAKAQQRIAKLTEDLRRKDQDAQRLMEESKGNQALLNQLQEKLASLESQHRQLLDNSLANMDPDTRAQVLLDGRLMEQIAASEQRLMSQILPHLQKFERQAEDSEMRRLSSTCPGFNVELHGPLIAEFRRGNPRCSVEQAFRAVAEPEELQMAAQVRASRVPPVVTPGNGRVQSRYSDEQKQSDPERELVEEANQLKKLMSSTDPTDKAQRDRFLHQHLAKRLDRILPK
jgi:hypothetical protein